MRLWPASRSHRPKQLCKFINNKSMLDHTIDRLVAVGSSRIAIITSDDLADSIHQLVEQRPDADIIEILSEPVGKNTAPAVGLALARYHNEAPHAVMGVFPADHHILDTNLFKESIHRAIQAAEQDQLATIGINPDRPETGYGYIEKTKWEIGNLPNVYQVNSFCEKPDLDTAQLYLSSGQHMWNAGIYVARVDIFMKEFEKHLPEIYKPICVGYEAYMQSYKELPAISLDYGIAEKSNRMAVVPADFGWCDLGSWNALENLCNRDEYSNVCNGDDIIVLESSNCVVNQVEKTVVLFGVNDILVVESNDVILVTERGKAQDLRTVVNSLQKQNRIDLI